MKRIPILYVVSTPELSGSTIELIHTIKYLDLNKYKPFFIVPPQNVEKTADFSQFKETVKTMRIGVIKRTRNPLVMMRFIMETCWAIPALYRIIKKERIRIVHTNASVVLSAPIAAKLCKVPSIWHIHEIISPPILRLILCRIILGLSDKVVVISKTVGNQFKCSASPKIEIVYDGIDLNNITPALTPQEGKAKLGFSFDTPLVGMVGRFVPWKGQKVFIEACALIAREFPKTHFIVAGQTFDELKHYIEELESLAEKLDLGSRVHFKYWHDDIYGLISSLDILVHASEKPEPFGLVAIEAMALSKPVIGTIGGIREIVTKDVGITIPAKNIVALSEAAVYLLRNKDKAQLMGHRGRQRVEKLFTAERTAKKIDMVYQNVLRGNEKSRDLIKERLRSS